MGRPFGTFFTSGLDNRRLFFPRDARSPMSSSDEFATRPPFYRRPSFWLAFVLIALGGLSVAWSWDTRAVLWFKESRVSPDTQASDVWLPAFHAEIDGKPMLGLEKDEASDLSYNPATNTLFSVMGKNAFLVELNLNGDVLRKIALNGWSNPEGVAVLENGVIAIVDERVHDVVMVRLTPETRELNHADFPHFDLGPSKDQNKAFEGIAWDPRHQQIVFGEERPPRLFTWKSDGSDVLKGDKQLQPNDSLIMRNLSALTIDPRTGHLLALSAESHLLLELDEQGKDVSFMTLLHGFNGLAQTIPRAEGVAFDKDGNLYMVSEPNLFYKFVRR